MSLLRARARRDADLLKVRQRWATDIAGFRHRGFTLAEIAGELGVTRQAVADTLKRSS